MIRTYSELLTFDNFEDRFEYLKLSGSVGIETFGSRRYLNQSIYQGREWKRVRDKVVLRDDGCDLAMFGYDIFDRIYVHHLNPLTIRDLEREDYSKIFDLENLVCVSFYTHEAIHYGDSNLLPKLPIERKPGDTKLW